jgi:hypothetical protein
MQSGSSYPFCRLPVDIHAHPKKKRVIVSTMSEKTRAVLLNILLRRLQGIKDRNENEIYRLSHDEFVVVVFPHFLLNIRKS